MQINIRNSTSGAAVIAKSELLIISEAADCTAFQMASLEFDQDVYLPGGKFTVEVKP